MNRKHVPHARIAGPRPFGIALALAATLPVTAAAQEPPDTFRLAPIVVTATRVPTPLRAVPVSITVLEGDTLRAAGLRFVADALRSVPGLTVVRSGATGGLTSLFMRGAESDHVQVLVDGVPVNDPGGAVDIAHLTLADVERIEIVRGPASVLYGTDAAAGVIQVFTRRGTGPARLDLALGGSRSGRVGPATGGSNGFDTSVGVNGGSRRAAWGLSASRLHSDGLYASNNEYGNTTLGGSLRLRPRAGTGLSVTVRGVDGRFHFPTDGGGKVVDDNQFRDTRTLGVGIEAEQAIGTGIELHAAIAAHSADQRLDDAPDGPADTVGFYALALRDGLRRRRAELFANLRSGSTVLTIGAAAERQEGESELISHSSFGPYLETSSNERSSGAGFLQLMASPRAGLTLTAGSRLDRSDRFGSHATWRVGLKLDGGRGAVRFAAGTGFKEPTFYENFATGFVRGNPGLEPERTQSAELGLERDFAGGRLRLEATTFIQRLRNLIQYTAEPPAADASNYFNVGQAEAAGLELAARLSPAGGFGFDVAWTLLRTRVTDAGFGTDRAFLQDRPLLRRPRHHGSLSAHGPWLAGRLDARLSVVGRRDDLDFSDPADFGGTRVLLPAHALLDVSWERTLIGRAGGRRVDGILRGENLLDERYQEIRGFPASGRTLGIGLRVGS